MTKPLLLVIAAGLFASAAGPCCRAADTNATAYTALRVMGKSLGQDTISRVVEVTGRRGTPQPEAWRIVILDGTKGTREVTVSGGRVVAQKSAGPSDARPIRLQDLNLDSSGAFEAADTEARKAKVPFTALDYSLRVNPASGKPVWNLELFNSAGARVGGVRLAAHDGTMIAVNGLTPGRTTTTTTTRPLVSTTDADHDSVRPTRVVPGSSNTTTTTTTTYSTVRNPPAAEEDDNRRDPDAPSSNEGGFFSRAGRTLDHTTDAVGDTLNRTGHAVNQTMRRTGAKIQRFFSGGDSEQND